MKIQDPTVGCQRQEHLRSRDPTQTARERRGWSTLGNGIQAQGAEVRRPPDAVEPKPGNNKGSWIQTEKAIHQGVTIVKMYSSTAGRVRARCHKPEIKGREVRYNSNGRFTPQTDRRTDRSSLCRCARITRKLQSQTRP